MRQFIIEFNFIIEFTQQNISAIKKFYKFMIN